MDKKDNKQEKTEYNKQENKEENKEDYYIKNLCIECGIDMGYCNPRQYCGKTRCLYSDN